MHTFEAGAKPEQSHTDVSRCREEANTVQGGGWGHLCVSKLALKPMIVRRAGWGVEGGSELPIQLSILM